MSLGKLESVCRLALCPSAPEGEWTSAAVAFFRLCRSKNLNPFNVNLTRASSVGSDGPTMPFGKYKGKTVEWVVSNDSSYAEWVLEKVQSRRLREAIEVALEDFYHG